MSNANKIDPVFIAGMHSDAHDVNPHIWSSNNWLLWEAGRLWVVSVRSEPMMARKSRGYTARIDTHANEWIVKFTGDALTPSLERI
jgi:hypothetical protein